MMQHMQNGVNAGQNAMCGQCNRHLARFLAGNHVDMSQIWVEHKAQTQTV